MSYHVYPNGDVLLLDKNATPPSGYVQDTQNRYLYHGNGFQKPEKGVTVEVEVVPAVPPPAKQVKPKSLVEIINGAYTAFVYYIKSGGEVVPDLVKQQRMSCCDTCDYRIKRLGIWICTSCWCVLQIKTALPDQQCPLSQPRWTAYGKYFKGGGCPGCSQSNDPVDINIE